jgi:hypothetical protein
MQLQAEGKTETAQKDLARLAKIKAEREAAQAKRKAEADGMWSTVHLGFILPFGPAKAAEIEAKKGTGKR